jgi:hypothetical protein
MRLPSSIIKYSRYIILFFVVLVFFAIFIATRFRLVADDVTGNDNFADAYPVTEVGTIYTGSNLGFTVEDGEYLPNSITSTAWIALTLPKGGYYSVEICTPLSGYSSIFYPANGFSQSDYLGTGLQDLCPLDGGISWYFYTYPDQVDTTFYFQIGTVSGSGNEGEYKVLIHDNTPPSPTPKPMPSATPTPSPTPGPIGSESNPYPISTCSGLQAMNNDLDSYYAITDNIDCAATSGWNSNTGFIPVGIDEGSPFTGGLDGKGFVISNLFINNLSQYNIGLFGVVNNSTLTGINLINIDYIGANNIGGLVGSITNVTIDDCSVTGSISGADWIDSIGGLVGGSYGVANISNSYAETNIDSGESSSQIGGLVGANYGTLTISTSNTKTSMDFGVAVSDVGGLLGSSFDSLIISNSSAEFEITEDLIEGEAAENIGGLVGADYASINILNSNASVNINLGDSNWFVGGLIGGAFGDEISIVNSYSNGDILAGHDSRWIGGIAGTVYEEGLISNSHSTVNITSGDQSQSTGGFLGEIACYIECIIQNSSSSGSIISGNDLRYFGGFIGQMYGLVLIENSYSTSALSTQQGIIYLGGFLGSTFGGDPIIRTSYSSGNINTVYSTINDPYNYNDYIGGFVGMAVGITIEKSYSLANEVNGGYMYVGGFVGLASDIEIEESYSLVSQVNGYQYVGGFVGLDSDDTVISNSYARTSVTTSYAVNPSLVDDSPFAGGFGGLIAGTVINSYSTGTVTGYTNTISNVNTTLTSSVAYDYNTITLASVSGIEPGGYLFIEDVQEPFSSTLSQYVAQGSLSIPITNISGFIQGDSFILEQGVPGKEEEHWINSIDGNTIGLYDYSGYYDTQYAHDSGSSITLIPRILSDIVRVIEVNGNNVLVENIGNRNAHTAGKEVSSYEIMPNSKLGGFSGPGGGTVTNSYWDTQTSGLDNSSGGTGLTTSQLKTQSNLNGWDFDNTWVMYSGLNDGYPSLDQIVWTDYDCSGSCGSGATCNQYGDPPQGKMWSCRYNGSAYKCLFDDINAGGNNCYLDCNSGWQSCGCNLSACESSCLSEHANDGDGSYTYTDTCGGCGQYFTCSCEIAPSATPTPTLTPTITPTPGPLCSLNRDGNTWCQNHGGSAMTIPDDIPYGGTSSAEGWAACLSWCDANMNSTTLPICQFNNDGPRNCWINRAPGYVNEGNYGDINNCNWTAGPNPYGAWSTSFIDPFCTTPTPSPTPTPTPVPTNQVENLNNLYESHLLPDNNIGLRLDVGYNGQSTSDSQRIGIFNTQAQQLIADITADFSIQNLDLTNFVIDSSSDMGTVYINSTEVGGVSGITDVLGPSNLYLKSNAGLNINRLNDTNTTIDMWGEAVQIDDNNNIALVEMAEDDLYLYIWRNPTVFSNETYDEKLLLNGDYLTQFVQSASVSKLGDNKFMVSWTEFSYINSVGKVIVKIIDNNGNLLSDDIEIISNDSFPEAVSLSKVSNGTVMVTWESPIDLEENPNDVALAQLIETDGTLIGSVFQVNEADYNIMEPGVNALSNGNFVFIFYDEHTEQVYYRIWDPDTSGFIGFSVLVDLIDANNFAGGYNQVIATDDNGGFGVLLGGYFDDGIDFYDRVFFQMYNSDLDPFYTNAGDIYVNNYETSWYQDVLGVSYYKGTYQLVWDISYDNYDYVGVVYRKILETGEKGDIILLDKAYIDRQAYNITMDVDRNGVPIIVWPRNFYIGPSNSWSIAGFWGAVPGSNPDRVGYCPNATSLSQVNNNCSGLTYTKVGSGDLSWSPPVGGFVDFKLSNVDSGGAFVDSPPAIAFKDFASGQEISDSLNVSWYDTGALGGGTISFYYDIDNIGLDGTLITSGISASSAVNTASLDLSGLSSGTYWIYAKIDDGYYDPYYAYAPESIDLSSPFTNNGYNLFLPQGLTGRAASNLSKDLSIDKVLGPVLVRIAKANSELSPLADISVDFTTNYDWSASGLVGDTSSTLQKAFMHSLVDQTGAAGTYTLYIPIKSGLSSDAVAICPGVNSFEAITSDCADVQLLGINSSGVSKVYHNGQQYWKVEGLTGTGGLAINNQISVSDTLTRLKVGVLSDHTITFNTIDGLTESGNTIEVDMENWDVSDLTISDLSLLDDNTELNLASTSGVNTWGVSFGTGLITLTAPTSGSGFIDADSIIVLKIGFVAGGSNQVINPAIVDSYPIIITNTTPNGAEGGEISIPIVDSDQVNITGYVNAFISFDIDTGTLDEVDCSATECKIHGGLGAGTSDSYTVDLGELKSTYVNKSGEARMHSDGILGDINSIYLDLSTNAQGGAIVNVTSATNNGLVGPSGSNILPVTNGSAIDSNSGKYGFNVAQTSYVAGVGIGTYFMCNELNTSRFCGPSTTASLVFNTSSYPIDSARVRMDIAAAATYTNTPGLYTDTLTFVATATF